MSSTTHNVKKRLSVMAKRTSTIEKNISAPYTAAKTRTIRERKTLEEAVKLIEASNEPWLKVTEQNKKFAELIETEAPIESSLHSTASPAVASTRAAHISAGELAKEPVVAFAGHVKALVTEMLNVEKDFKVVETAFNETQRYEKKVEKLTKKDSKAEKAQRNNDKLQGARAAYESKLEAVLSRMERIHSKFEAGIQSAQTAYWVRQDGLLKNVEKATVEPRKTANSLNGPAKDLGVTAAEVPMIKSDGEKMEDKKAEKMEAKIEQATAPSTASAPPTATAPPTITVAKPVAA